MDLEKKSPYTVTEYIREINAKLSTVSGGVIGEVTEVKKHSSGHVYFTIKDKDSGDVLPCTIWKTKYALSSVDMEKGMELLVKGKPEYYGPFGKLSLIANSIELVGEGALLKAYEKLKNKLEDEGLFNPSRKRSIPAYPNKIGVITSVHGDVIHDFTKNLGRYGYDVKILDTRVEGPESGKDLALSIRNFRAYDIDVLVLLRGGGSLQSLAGFDNEALVREIVSFPKPVIAGIGHHQNVPLAALAADAAESTPSLVAELLNESWSVASHSLERSETKILKGYELGLLTSKRDLDSALQGIERGLTGIFEIYKEAERSIKEGVSQIGFQLNRIREGVEEDGIRAVTRFEKLTERVTKEYLTKVPVRVLTTFGSYVKNTTNMLGQLERLTETNNPERQLKLGYSLAFSEGKLVRSSKDLAKGSILDIRFAKGGAEAEIQKLTY